MIKNDTAYGGFIKNHDDKLPEMYDIN